ncbi:cell division protein FtsQ/DivIB [Vibrio sp. RC27]
MTQSVIDKSPQLSDSKMIKRHLFGAIFFVSVIILLVTLFYSTISWMWDEQRLPLSKVIIQGDLQYVKSGDVQHALGQLSHIGTFMSQDVLELQNTVEQLPWVEHASIHKQWPDTIKIFLTEHNVEAIWNGNELLDEHGVVFEGDLGLLEEDYVKLYGPDGTGLALIETWKKYTPILQQLGLQVSSLVLNERRAWQFILDNGIRLELGKESLDERINRFVALYRDIGQKVEQISYIDLRYDTGAAIGWFPVQEEEQENIND